MCIGMDEVSFWHVMMLFPYRLLDWATFSGFILLDVELSLNGIVYHVFHFFLPCVSCVSMRSLLTIKANASCV